MNTTTPSRKWLAKAVELEGDQDISAGGRKPYRPVPGTAPEELRYFKQIRKQVAKNVGEVATTDEQITVRTGSIRPPLRKGRSVVVGSKTRIFTGERSKKLSPRTRAIALRKALSERLEAGDVVVLELEDSKLAPTETKELVKVINALELKGTTLVVSSGADKNLIIASCNVTNLALATSDSLNTYDVLRPDKLVFTRSAFKKVEARLIKK